MSEKAIEIKNLVKSFKVYDDVFVDRLKEALFFWNKDKYFNYFTALDNVSFSLNKGEVVGLIGTNGAGKTTLLKALAKIIYPTSGEIKVNGSMVAVLALGLGFNPRFTGRENILIGGSILGMSLEEIKEKEAWIIEFSELKDFIDQPVRSYSSGMQARLSFSVAAAVSPDVLVVDEALATGDAFFVQKSLGRIHDICKSGTTAIFVSHNLMQIQRLCSERVILLEKGRIKNDDKAHKVIEEYNDLLLKYREEQALKARTSFSGEKINLIQESLDSKDFRGNGDIIVEKIFFTDEIGDEISTAKTGDNVTLYIDYFAKKGKKDIKIIVTLENYSGLCAYGFQSDNYFDKRSNKLIKELYDFKEGKGTIKVDFEPLLLTTNKYILSVTLYDYNALLLKDADYLDQTVFAKKHMTEISVLKPHDLNNTLIFEHPVSVNIIPE